MALKRRRLLWILLSPIVALLLLELVLQAGALVVSWSSSGAPVEHADSGEALRVMSLGDSNTFGLYLDDRDMAYPKLLESVRRSSGGTPVSVVNLGYPGRNTTAILAELAADLDRYRPDIVTLMVGINDFWIPIPEGMTGATQAAPSAPVRWLRRHSRVYKFGYMLMRRVSTPDISSPQADKTLEPVLRQLRANLGRIHERISAQGAELILVTYPYGSLQSVCNEVLREFASSSGLALADSAPAYAERCGDRHCADLLYDDNHPREAGHRLIAEALEPFLP